VKVTVDRIHEQHTSVTDADVRVWLQVYGEACEAGPSMRDDFLAATAAAMRDARQRSLRMTIDDWEQIDSLSRMLRRMFGIGDDRATLLAKEHLLRSPRREMLEVARRYRELILTEAEQRRERERRNDPAPTPIGYPLG
jgi:hypothetical protein